MKKKVLAVSSGGGHWVQLMRLREAFEDSQVTYVTVSRLYREDVHDHPMHVVTDATRWNKLKLVVLLFQILLIVLQERPDVVVSTGAAPGVFALLCGKVFGARNVWLDSIANSERLSLSGSLVGRVANLWLTQWPHLAKEGGPVYRGTVL